MASHCARRCGCAVRCSDVSALFTTIETPRCLRSRRERPARRIGQVARQCYTADSRGCFEFGRYRCRWKDAPSPEACGSCASDTTRRLVTTPCVRQSLLSVLKPSCLRGSGTYRATTALPTTRNRIEARTTGIPRAPRTPPSSGPMVPASPRCWQSRCNRQIVPLTELQLMCPMHSESLIGGADADENEHGHRQIPGHEHQQYGRATHSDRREKGDSKPLVASGPQIRGESPTARTRMWMPSGPDKPRWPRAECRTASPCGPSSRARARK